MMISKSFFPLALVLTLCGCQNATEVTTSPQNTPREVAQTSSHIMNNPLLGQSMELPRFFSLERLQDLVRQGELQKASQFINEALQVGVKFPALHVLNGMVYEERARRGESACADLVSVAYRAACTLDPSQWSYAYLYGCYALREKQYSKAQEYLARARMLNAHNPHTAYALACASYYTKDLPVAMASINSALQKDPHNLMFNRAGALIAAACSRDAQSQKCFAYYKKSCAPNDPDITFVEKRLAQWKTSHANFAKFENVFGEIPEYMGEGSHHNSAQKKTITKKNKELKKIIKSARELMQKKQSMGKRHHKDDNRPKVIVFDCYFLRSNYSSFTSMGQNILDSLSVVLGGDGSQPYFSFNNTRKSSGDGPSTGGWTKNFAFSVNAQSLNYSLNIANAQANNLEISCRPTVTTLLGTPAYFITGDQYTGATSGVTGSTVASVDDGTKMQILPVSLNPEGILTINISMDDSLFINKPNLLKGVASQLISLSKATLSTTVRARAGETIFIGGITSIINNKRRYATPFLGDIPIVQYLFGMTENSQGTHHAMFLICPRWKTVEKQNTGPSVVAQKLVKAGLMSVGEHTVLYHILKHLETAPMFQHFRSGDIQTHYNSYGPEPLEQKLETLASFFYF